MENQMCRNCGGVLVECENSFVCTSCFAEYPATKPKALTTEVDALAKSLANARELMELEIWHARTEAYQDARDRIKRIGWENYSLPNRWEVLFFPEYCKALDLFLDYSEFYNREYALDIEAIILDALRYARAAFGIIKKDIHSQEKQKEAYTEVSICCLELLWLTFSFFTGYFMSDKTESYTRFLNVLQNNSAELVTALLSVFDDRVTAELVRRKANEAFALYDQKKARLGVLSREIPRFSYDEEETLRWKIGQRTKCFWERNATFKAELEAEKRKLIDMETKFVRTMAQEYKELEKTIEAKRVEYKKTSFLHPYKLDRLEKEIRALDMKRRGLEQDYVALKSGYGKAGPIHKKISRIDQFLGGEYFFYKGPIELNTLFDMKEEFKKIKEN